MTAKDYAEIQRNLGYIEGLIADCNTIVYDGITAAIDAIDEILDREMKTRTESLLMHDLPIEPIINIPFKKEGADNGKPEQDH